MQHVPHPWNSSCVPGAVSNIPYDRLPEVGCLPPTAPISVTTYVTTPSPAWAQTVPSPMPWMGGDPRGIGTHYFSAAPDPCTSSTATSWELLNHLGGGASNAHTHLKRKGDAPDPAPHKICVTEERMAARFQDMHISNRFMIPSEDTPVTPEGSVTNLNQLDYILKDSDATSPSKSLVLAPELKKLVEPEKIFASTFLSKVERPSMALVLWQPKGTKPTDEGKTDTEEEKPFLPSHLSALCSRHLLAKPTSTKSPEIVSQDVEME